MMLVAIQAYTSPLLGVVFRLSLFTITCVEAYDIEAKGLHVERDDVSQSLSQPSLIVFVIRNLKCWVLPESGPLGKSADSSLVPVFYAYVMGGSTRQGGAFSEGLHTSLASTCTSLLQSHVPKYWLGLVSAILSVWGDRHECIYGGCHPILAMAYIAIVSDASNMPRRDIDNYFDLSSTKD